VTHILSIALVLQLHNLAGAPPAVVDNARSELTRMYGELGVAAQWDDTDRPDVAPDAVRIVILRKETGRLQRRGDVVMGAALRTPSGARMIYVFYERVRAEAERYDVSTALVLACAMAHELGHLLLPGDGHSRNGLMRPCWSRDDFQRADQGLLRFSPYQASQVRTAAGR
jgi:hypothetical protein